MPSNANRLRTMINELKAAGLDNDTIAPAPMSPAVPSPLLSGRWPPALRQLQHYRPPLREGHWPVSST